MTQRTRNHIARWLLSIYLLTAMVIPFVHQHGAVSQQTAQSQQHLGTETAYIPSLTIDAVCSLCRFNTAHGLTPVFEHSTHAIFALVLPTVGTAAVDFHHISSFGSRAPPSLQA